MANYDAVYRAVAFFHFTYGRIDWLGSNNEYWLERDAALRTDCHITSEIKMHLRVFKENPKVQGVVHAHPLTATAFACAGISLEEPVLMEGVLSLGCVPLVHFALPGTEEVPEAVAPYCREYNAVLLANHGALTWGENLMQAYYRMETTEYYAKILMMNNFILGKKTLLSQGQIDDIIRIRAGWGITTGGRPIGPESAQNLEDICVSKRQ